MVPGGRDRAGHALAVDLDAETPAAGLIGLTVTDTYSGDVLTPACPAGQLLASVLPVTRVRIGAETRGRYAPDVPAGHEPGRPGYADGLQSVARVPEAGATLDLTLYWRAEGPLLYDYTVFVHLVDSADTLVAQDDSQPLNDDYPTSLWTMGEEIPDNHTLDLPASMEPGEYWIEVGMYRLDTGERLIIGETNPATDHVRLGPLFERGLE